jgi:hypothetical protein
MVAAMTGNEPAERCQYCMTIDFGALSVNWLLSETGLSGRRVRSLRCECELKHKPTTRRRPVVVFEEQRRTVLAEQAFEVGGDLAAVELGRRPGAGSDSARPELGRG